MVLKVSLGSSQGAWPVSSPSCQSKWESFCLRSPQPQEPTYTPAGQQYSCSCCCWTSCTEGEMKRSLGVCLLLCSTLIGLGDQDSCGLDQGIRTLVVWPRGSGLLWSGPGDQDSCGLAQGIRTLVVWPRGSGLLWSVPGSAIRCYSCKDYTASCSKQRDCSYDDACLTLSERGTCTPPVHHL
ncbi:hypothetical protein EYF80_062050 [Liparis tanakae]|uniref:Uncharacterized protein n=1 Tax=Liparis tanakae TaxID=230148 RepID=A0A4Z2EH58_9TELE|nr:hypothetical protein EYF80_062050 [Liparis tanakae]